VQVALGKNAVTTAEAFAEYTAGVHSGRIAACDWSWLPVLHLDETERQHVATLRLRLGGGEAACIALAHNRQGRLLSDDRDARKVALQIQAPVSGTIGILARLVEQQVLSVAAADVLLGRMIDAGYHSPLNSLHELR
jgi:predicted nucleic acid-binding protein